MAGTVPRRALAAILVLSAAAPAPGSDVSGRVTMSELCSPSVSPAVVRLESVDAPAPASNPGEAAAHLIDQRGLRFEPRVVAMRVGESLHFGNADPEPHGVNVQGSGVGFNRVVAPGGAVEFVPEKAGVFRVVCDVHSHMRAYVVVADSPWVTACDRNGAFRFRGVPEGRYRLVVWHEMGAPMEREVGVKGPSVDLGTFVAAEGPNPVTAADREQVCETGCEPWPMVIDRIAVTLSASLDAARHPGSTGRAVPLAQDAFYRDFASSGMATAVRVHLGRDRASQIEDLFVAITETTVAVVAGDAPPPRVIVPTRQALLTLAKASEELSRKGVTERSKTFAKTSPAFWVEEGPAVGPPAAPGGLGGVSATALGVAAGVVGVLLVLAFPSVRALQPESGTGNGRVPVWRVGLLLAASGLAVVVAVVTWPGRTPPGAAPVAGAPAVGAARDPVVPSGATVREYPIGLDVTRNHLRVAALWQRAVRPAGAAAPAAGDVHLVARVHATEGNPNGFARGEWVPYLSISYTIEPARGGPSITGTLRPLLAGDGPRYGANVTLPGPGAYRLRYRLLPPSPGALGRVVDPADGVAPWWEPFEVAFAWPYTPAT